MRRNTFLNAAPAAHRETIVVFGIGVGRKHALKWLFPQEKATFHRAQKVYVYSETALEGELVDIPVVVRRYALACVSGVGACFVVQVGIDLHHCALISVEQAVNMNVRAEHACAIEALSVDGVPGGNQFGGRGIINGNVSIVLLWRIGDRSP
jgi:hypothetical protein